MQDASLMLIKSFFDLYKHGFLNQCFEFLALTLKFATIFICTDQCLYQIQFFDVVILIEAS